MKEVVFRDFFTEYTREERLLQFIPLYYIRTPELIIIKEILDNAADSVEETGTYEIFITLSPDTISIKNHGVIPERVFDEREFSRGFLSSKFGFKSLTRGLIGHGLKICICLYLFYFKHQSFKVESGKYLYTFCKEISPETQETTLTIKRETLETPSDYTTVILTFPDSREFANIREYIYQYILLNPHITFHLQEKQGTWIFERVKKININKKADIMQYSQTEFGKVFANYKKGVKKFSLHKFLSNFNIPSTHLRNLSEIKNSSIKELYEFVKSHSKEVKLPKLNKKIFDKRFGDMSIEILSFKETTTKDNSDSLIIFTTPQIGKNKIVFSYNGSILSPESIVYLDKSSKITKLNVEDLSSKLSDKRLFIVYYSKNLQTYGRNKDDIIIPFNLNEILKSFIKKEDPTKLLKRKHFWWIQSEKIKEYKSYLNSQQSPDLLIDFSGETLSIKHYFINDAYRILKSAYEKYGPISIRSLYYQLITQGIILSDQDSYHAVVNYLSEAREKGYIPWDMFIDESRPFYPPPPSVSLEVNPLEHIQQGLKSVLTPPAAFDLWEKLKIKVEVWVEKVAIIPVLEPITDKYYVGIQPAKGFSSGTILDNAVKKVISYTKKGFTFYILYFGDFNPSGLCIWEKIQKKLNGIAILKKLAINPDQIENIPVNPEPPKSGDTRTPEFIKKYGDKCYELEAFDFDFLRNLLEQEILNLYKTEQFQSEINNWLEKFNKIKDLLYQNLKNTPFLS